MRFKSFFLVSALSLLCTFSYSQTLPFAPWSTSVDYYSQMLNVNPNTAGAYFTGSNGLVVGNQLDTFPTTNNPSPLYLVCPTSKQQSSPKQDTIYSKPLYGSGVVSVGVLVRLATYVSTVSAVVHSTLYQSQSGQSYDWQPVAGVSVLTLTATTSNSVTPVTGAFQDVTKSGLYYAVGSTITGDTASIQSQIYYLKNSYVIPK